MSSMIDIKDLKDREMFVLPNGSVYIMQRRTANTGKHQAHVVCSHPPDALTSEQPLIDFPPEQQVRRLSAIDAREHYAHEGYVSGVFAREMEHRHQVALRPWWKKLLG
jgi:hypothetical protein